MSLLLISQAYSQLDESFTDENEEISKQDVQPVEKCSVESIKKLVCVKQAVSRKYELRKRRLDPVRSSDDLEIKKEFSLKSKTISKRSCKPSSKRNVQRKLDTNSTVQSKNSPNTPDLYSRAWPFNHLKLVLNFKSEANSSPKKKVSLTTADNWKREGEMFVYYDTLTSADKERLYRMKEGYYSCSESEGELEELDVQESEQVTESNLDESLYSRFTPVKERKKISKSVGTNAIKHKENFENQAVSFDVTKNEKRAADLNKAEIHENEKLDRSPNSYFEEVLTRFKNERKQKPVFDKTAVIKLEKCDNLVQQSPTTTALRETTNTRKANKRNCKLKEKPFKCTQCSKEFSKSWHLSAHEQVHIERKPFKCPTCPKIFLWQKNLRTHIKALHSKNGKEKPKCPICFKSFYSSYNLKTHREIVHLKMRPFQCSICFKQFGEKGTLKVHNRCHTKEKPFECPACKKRFGRKNHLREHIKRKHNQI